MPVTLSRGQLMRWRLAEHDGGDALRDIPGVGELTARLLWGRNVREPAAAKRFLEPRLTHLHDPATLPGAPQAATRIVEALHRREPIVIYGDYDVDGVTATAILYHTLKTADPHAPVTCYVPHRIDEGYGLNTDAINTLIDDGAKLILSVDCGITATGPAAAARDRNIDLIITDHHEVSAELPGAFALVHPRLPGSAYPWGELCGAGVAYKLAWQIARTFCGSDRVTEIFKKLLVDLLPLAALGTIADVVPLVDENRTIAMFGLGRIKQTPLVGLNALIDAARLRDEKIDSYHVGFVLGPRLNACGRMGHAKEAVRLLTDAPPDEAKQIAEFLTTQNDQRRATERRIFEQAREMVAELGFDHPDVRAIVLGHDEWHPGVVGIVCSRLVEAFGRPTVLVNTANGHAHGSARSIDGFNIHHALTTCSCHLEKFGGHAMAAGLTLATENLPAFREAMIGYAREQLKPADLVAVLEVDAAATLETLNLATVEQLRKLAPFGRANPEPVVLIEGVTVAQAARPLGSTGAHLSMLVRSQGGVMVRCIGWKMAEFLPRLGAGVRLDLAATPTINRWNGRSTVELTIRDLRWA